MQIKGQTKFAQRRRISEGCCPVHGVGLSQAIPESHDDGSVWDWAKCTRGDCAIEIAFLNGDWKQPVAAKEYEL